MMKLSVMLPWDIMNILTPSPTASRTSKSSTTPGRDLEDRWSLDKIPDVGSWWNFQWCFLGILWTSWHLLQLHQDHPSPPRLQEETWRIGGVLTRFLILDVDETYEHLATISNSIKNIHVLIDSRKINRGLRKSCLSSLWLITVKLSAMFFHFISWNLYPFPYLFNYL